ncbi:MAG: hypothetical protein M3R04_07935, partial [bacterium]|nr:hypothetical protein [bacterium]
MRTHVSSGNQPILIFERSHPGRHGTQVHAWGPQAGSDNALVATSTEAGSANSLGSTIPLALLRTTPVPLPEVQELELVRHYIALSREQYGIDTGFYPLGSCTMKYNP